MDDQTTGLRTLSEQLHYRNNYILFPVPGQSSSVAPSILSCRVVRSPYVPLFFPSPSKGALFALKRKKLYEGEIMKLQGARITLDSQISALESAVVNIETFNAMKSGAQALKGIRGNMYVVVVMTTLVVLVLDSISYSILCDVRVVVPMFASSQ